jgi:formylglycine-generating enzyme required for sulfatase activity
MLGISAVVALLCVWLVGCRTQPQPPSPPPQQTQKQETKETPPNITGDFKPIESEGRDKKTGLWNEIEHVQSGIRLRLMPAGGFEMGSNNGNPDEKPVHRVKIEKPFYMGKYEVTQAQWKAIMGARSRPSLRSGDNLPVEQVSWDAAREFCAKAGGGLRLPTEAEWEYACRAGSATNWFFGDDEKLLGEYAWYKTNSDVRTHEVGQKKPNGWGLYDMAGNVAEWCQDTYQKTYRGAPDDGRAWITMDDQFRVIRGGAWDNPDNPDNPAAAARSANRTWSIPALEDSTIGFRVAAPEAAGK